MAPSVNPMRQFYETLMDSQWWSSEKLRDFQRLRLSELVRYAHEAVPFYRNRLKPALTVQGELDWERWRDIPIVKRQDMIDHRLEMQSVALPPGHGPVTVAHTSGSTSLPIAVSTNGAAARASRAARLRSYANNKVDWTRNLAIRLGNTTAATDRPEGQWLGKWAPPWAPNQGIVWDLNVKLPVDLLLSFLRQNDCAYLNTGAAPAHVFSIEAERLGLAAPRLDAVLAQGASVGTADREACQRVFGARIIESYGSKEGGQMAHPCEHGVLHINCELCLIEIVDQEDNIVPEGSPGRVVVTPFYSTAQPLIRYDQGDIARMGSGCRCGRQSPTLLAIEGRDSLFFTHPDGRRASSLVPEKGRKLLDCTFWQIAQTGPLSFEVRYVPNDMSVVGDEDAFVQLFRTQYFSDAKVELKRVPTIPLTASGKFVEYRVETGRP